MSNTCIDLLDNFTKKELMEFKSFVLPGVFNTDSKIYVLYNALKKHVIGKSQYNNQLEIRIYNTVFNKNFKLEKLKTPQKKKLNALMSSLTRLAENFLIYKLLLSNTETKKEVLYEVLLERRQLKLLEKHLKSDKKKLKEIEKKGTEYYKQIRNLEHYRFQVTHQTGLIAKQDNLEIIDENLDIYYILEKLSIRISMLSLEQITQRNFEHSKFTIIEKYVKNSNYKNNAAIVVCLAMVDLLEHKTTKHYNKLLQLLNKYGHIVSDEILIGGYNIAANFCSYNMKRGLFTHKHIFELYNILDIKNLLLEENFIPVNKLKNIVAIACRINEFDWATKTLKKYIEFVNNSFKKSVFQFNFGVINFYQKQYNEALQNFIRVYDVNLVYDINCRIMMMKAHYEVDEIYDERTLQIFRSAEKYFIANKLISVHNRTAYKNFVRMLINLYRIKHKVTKMKLSSFLNKLNSQKFNNDKNWLLSKLSEI